MSIEETLARLVAVAERIATSLEQRPDAAVVAEQAVEAARTKGRGKKAAADPAPAAEEKAAVEEKAPEPVAEAPAPVAEEKVAEPVVAPSVKDVQARCIALSKQHGRDKVLAIIAMTAAARGTTDNVQVSQHTPEELIALTKRLDEAFAPAEEF